MTARLREAAARAARAGVLPLLAEERLLATERVAAAMTGQARDTRRLAPDAIDPRRLRDGWATGDLLDHALAAGRRSLDRTIVEIFLRDYPVRHPRFAALATAAAVAAERHDWPWRDAGRRWRLWAGTDALRDAPSRAAALREAGLTGPLAAGAFAGAVLG